MHKNVIVRLLVYYVAATLALSLLFIAFPDIGRYMAAERARQGGRAALELDRGAPAQEFVTPTTTVQFLDPERSVPVVVSLGTALIVALPIVWVYQWTRPRRRYNQTFAQTLLVVPIAITLVVFLVKGSLALAFSLAGIVAAVRFRTSLDEPIDAVYLFLVIGTGLAAGVQLLFVAFIASLVFNAVVLTVWRLNVGSEPAVLQGWRLAEFGPAGVAPPSGTPETVAARAAVPGAAEEPGERFNSVLRLHVTDVQEAQRLAIPIIEDRAKAWQVAEIAQEADGSSVVEYDLRLKKSTDLAAFIKEIERGDPYVARVELLKKKKP
jgi:hypothetical protein